MECFHPHYQQSAVEVMRRCIKGMARGSGDVLKSEKKALFENIELKRTQTGRLRTMFALFTESGSQVAASHRKCRRLQALPAREHNPICHVALLSFLLNPPPRPPLSVFY